MTKTCTTCGQAKPPTEFYKDARANDGRYSSCKECVKARRKASREQARVVEANYRGRNRKQIRERDRVYYQKHREKRIEAVRRSRQKKRRQAGT